MSKGRFRLLKLFKTRTIYKEEILVHSSTNNRKGKRLRKKRKSIPEKYIGNVRTKKWEKNKDDKNIKKNRYEECQGERNMKG